MDDARAMGKTSERAPTRSDHREGEAKKPFKRKIKRSSVLLHSRILFRGDIFKNQTDTFSRHHQKEESIRNEEEPTPYALAAAVTADESGAIDPGDNPVAFFTQLSDAFLFEPLPEDMMTPLLFFCCFDDAFFRFCRQTYYRTFVVCCWGAFETEKFLMKFAFLPPS